MKIHLNEIPEDGRSWSCNRQTAELNDALFDLIKDQEFQIEFTIRPMQSGTYEIQGSLQTGYTDDCSRCGDELKLKISKRFKDLLMPELEDPRNSHYAKSNHVSDLMTDGPDVFHYIGNNFFANDYFHEKIALEQPTIPQPSVDAQGKCLQCHRSLFKDTFVYDETMETKRKPFEQLKGLKL